MQSLKKQILEVKNDLETLDLALESLSNQMDLLRMANENTTDEINEQNGHAYQSLRATIDILREKYLEKSYRTLLDIDFDKPDNAEPDGN